MLTSSRPRRQARLKTTAGAGTCKCKCDMLVAPVNATYVKPFSTMLSGFNALPVPSLRQVYFLIIFESFFGVSFLFVFGEVLDVLLGAIGSILESFGGHFEVILVTFGR